MTEHIGAGQSSTNAPLPAPGTETNTSPAPSPPGWANSTSSSPRGPEGHLIHQALRPLPKKREGARTLPHGDVRTGGIHPQGGQDYGRALRGTAFSKSTVSSLSAGLDTELDAWRERSLSETAYPYLIVDATYEKVRRMGRVVSLSVSAYSTARISRLPSLARMPFTISTPWETTRPTRGAFS